MIESTKEESIVDEEIPFLKPIRKIPKSIMITRIPNIMNLLVNCYLFTNLNLKQN